jgi:hypothetical protein
MSLVPRSACTKARRLMAGFIDGDLAEEQSARDLHWFETHIQSCEDCRVRLDRFTVIDGELIGWGQGLDRQNPRRQSERERLSAKFGSNTAVLPFPATSWIVAAVIATTAILLLVAVPHQPQTDPKTSGQRADHLERPVFVQIPYLAPLDAREYATVVRIDLSVATLIAMGYHITADPGAIVPADVLVGEDGRAHAVHVLSDVGLNF